MPRPKVFQVPDLAIPVYTAESLSFLPPYLSAEYTVKRSVVRETITEILVADIGERTASSPYLFVCNPYSIEKSCPCC